MIKRNYFVVLVLLCCALGQWSLQLGTDWLQYSRPDIEVGQWWRFLTGNFIHLSWRHFAMNAVALIVIILLFANILRPIPLFVVLILSSLAVTTGLWLFSPTVYWYVGLSGALHGTLIVLLVLDYLANKNIMDIVLMLLMLAKLVWEFFLGPLPGSESTAGGPVVVIAHLYGAIAGFILASCFIVKSKIIR